MIFFLLVPALGQTEILTDPDVLARGGLVGVLAVIVVGALNEWWVPGKTYRRALADAERWRDLAMRGSGIAEKAVGLVERD